MYFKASRAAQFLNFLLACAQVAVLVWAYENAYSPTIITDAFLYGGIAITSFYSLPKSILWLFQKPPEITMSKHGFQYNGFGDVLVPWAEVVSIGTFLTINLKDPHKYASGMNVIHSMNVRVIGWLNGGGIRLPAELFILNRRAIIEAVAHYSHDIEVIDEQSNRLADDMLPVETKPPAGSLEYGAKKKR